MPLTVRRLVYVLLSILGFAMMMPWMIQMRRIQAQIGSDHLAVESALDPSAAASLSQATYLFLAGLLIAASFLYAALTAGRAKAWRPEEDGAPRCRRCGSEVRFGLPRCPSCDQDLTW